MIGDRQAMIENLYQYQGQYTLESRLYKTSVSSFMNGMLGEDLQESGCITAIAIFQPHDSGKAMVSSKQKGILAGLEESCLLLDNYRSQVSYHLAMKNGRLIRDGDALEADEDPILYLEGIIITILEIERTLLNILQRMSGIATEVHELQQVIKNCGSHSRLAATRKLQWGRMDKKAFIVGGGLSHRRGLYDTMMIKDTEIDFWQYLDDSQVDQNTNDLRLKWVLESVQRCWNQRQNSKGLIVEVQSQEEALVVARTLKELQNNRYYPCSIMLDNFSPQEVTSTLEQCRAEGTYDWTLFEASGNMQGERIIQFAQTGIDVISTGSPTHSTNVLDIHMKVLK
jgi:nicotinate-nucleotide pyrophosphorylase (carboxylating)